MAYSFSKSKIPKSLSFPIKRSAFDILLGDSNIKSLSIVYFSVPRLSVVVEGRFLSADKKGWALAGMITLNFRAVPISEKEAIEKAVLNQGLVKFFKWAEKIEQAGNALRASDHYFDASWNGFELLVKEN